MLTDGMEELLADPDKVIRSASYNYLMLQRLSVEMGVHATAREMCRILGIKFDPNKHVASIKYAKVPDLSFHDAQKSDRRLHKAAKRRKYMDRILGIRRRNCG